MEVFVIFNYYFLNYLQKLRTKVTGWLGKPSAENEKPASIIIKRSHELPNLEDLPRGFLKLEAGRIFENNEMRI